MRDFAFVEVAGAFWSLLFVRNLIAIGARGASDEVLFADNQVVSF